MRSPHILRATATTTTPQDCIWLDTETTSQEIDADSHKAILWFGYAAHRRRIKDGIWSEPDWLRFESISPFWDWVESKLHGKCKLYLFAHNFAFDGPVLSLFNELSSRGWQLRQAVIESPPIILKWRRNDQTIICVDTLNIWRMPLDTIGKQINLPKLKMPSLSDDVEKWERYGKRDVEVIMKACLSWFDFIEREHLGGFAPTLASQAMRAFRHRFMFTAIYIDNEYRSLRLSRKALHGGRTECFYIGKRKGKFYLLDVNSMYPAVMFKEKFPIKQVACYNDVLPSEAAKWIKKYCVVAEVELITDEPYYPVELDGRLTFPTGRIVAGLTTPELRYALKRGHVHHIRSIALYENDYLFKPFVESLYKLRLEAKKRSDDVAAWQYKILMNSLFGKFAQSGYNYVECGTCDINEVRTWMEVDADTGTVERYRAFAGRVEVLQSFSESHDSFPAIAAHVTAYGRCQLYSFVQTAGNRNVFYTDTDSILTNAKGYKRLERFLHGSNLGRLKLEAVYSSIHIRGPKDYKFDRKERIKGIKKRAVKVATNTYEQDMFLTLKGLLRTGQLTAPIITCMTKDLKRKYQKGVVDKNGWVLPFRLHDW